MGWLKSHNPSRLDVPRRSATFDMVPLAFACRGKNWKPATPLPLAGAIGTGSNTPIAM